MVEVLYRKPEVADLTFEEILKTYGWEGQQFNNPTIEGGRIKGASFSAADQLASFEIFPDYDKTIGQIVKDDAGSEVFKVLIGGTDVGDVIMGNYAGGAGAKWDKSAGTFSVNGTITATTGSIGGFDIGADYIRDAADSMGMASTVTGGDDVRFWAGDTFANRATADFRVTEAGVLVATSATITGGDLTASELNSDVVDTDQIVALAVTNAKINDLAVSKLTAGTITSKDIVLAISAGVGDTAIRAGKTDFTNTETGFILGLDDSDSDLPKFYIGSSSAYLNWTGAALAVKGAFTIDSGSGIANLSDAGDLATKDEADANVLNMTNAPAEAGADVTSGHTANDTSNVNSIASTIIQPRAETLFKRFVFVGSKDDGLTEAGTVTRLLTTTHCNMATAGTSSGLSSQITGGDSTLDWDENFEVVIYAKNTSSSDSSLRGFLGLASSALGAVPTTARHMGFLWENTTIKTSTADGTTQETNTVVGSASSSFLTYRIVKTGGSIAFYLNDVLQFTHVTNVPSGSSSNAYFNVMIEDADDSTNFEFVVANGYVVLITQP